MASKPCPWRPERFQRVVWSDKSRFRLFENHGRVRVWKQPGERYRNNLIQNSRQAGDGSDKKRRPASLSLSSETIFVSSQRGSKFFSRMSMTKCTAESSTTFLVEVTLQLVSGLCSKTMLLLTDVRLSLSCSKTIKF